MSDGEQFAHWWHARSRAVFRIPLLAALLAPVAAMSACSAANQAAPTETVVATSASPTAVATSTSTSSTSTTSTTIAATTTTTTIPVIDTAVLADVIAAASLGPVPDGTPVAAARFDVSALEDNGCHVGWGATAPKANGCEFGDTTSDVVVVVTGDSHVAAWFGAFDEAGKANHWKIVMVTKRGCPTADVEVYSAVNRDVLDAPYPECDTWRANAVQYITDLHADLVVFPMLTRRGVVGYSGAGAVREWGKGLGRTLDAVGASGAKLLVIGDTPKTNGDNVPLCVSAHPLDIAPCGNTRSNAVLDERLAELAEAAPAHHATYVDPSNWFCTETFCPAVIANLVVYRDDSHLTDSYARYRWPQIAQAIRVALASDP
ncbi:MAG: hypothetical protein HY826_00335 [Actinobacteria bacterium]|nr:hypothetical protein [Actinomycetota bacterium]